MEIEPPKTNFTRGKNFPWAPPERSERKRNTI